MPLSLGYDLLQSQITLFVKPLVNRCFGATTDQFGVFWRTLLLVYVYAKLLQVYRIVDVEGVRAPLMRLLFRIVLRLPGVRGKIQQRSQAAIQDLEASILKERPQVLTRTLPLTGRSKETILKQLSESNALEKSKWDSGLVSGCVYHGGEELSHLTNQAYGMFSLTNPLHADIFPHTRQFEAEVISMVCKLFNGDDEVCGCLTSGGTESILMAMKAYRDRGRAVYGIERPNIVVCTTAHAAFMKAGQYFNIGVKQISMTASGEIDLAKVRKAVNDNTIAIVGSAPNFANGTVDPISALGKLALERGIGLHVDACLGSFVIACMERAGYEALEFDFRVPGVTSISCDTHKYGYAPKGTSVIMYRNAELRKYQYTVVSDWTGGIYATPCIAGSRAGGLAVATWAAMSHIGQDGYVKYCREIINAARHTRNAIQSIEGIELQGQAQVSVVAFQTAPGYKFDVRCVAEAMRELRGWNLNSLQNPAGVHIAFTLPTARNVDTFIADLTSAVAAVVQDEAKFQQGGVAMYGMAARVPATVVEDLTVAYLDTCYKA